MWEIRIMYCNSRTLQQVGRKSEKVSWQRQAAISCIHEQSWFTCWYFQKSKFNSSIYLCIPSGVDCTAAIHVLPVLCGSTLASYTWLLALGFVACTTNAKSWKAEMKYCHQAGYGNACSLHSLVDECAMRFHICMPNISVSQGRI